MKDLLRIADLSREDLNLLLAAAVAAKRQVSHHRPGLLNGQIVVLYFAIPSTRTRLSFEAAVSRLGGMPVTVGPTELQLGRGETIEDTARVMSRYAAAVVARTSRHHDVHRLAAAASVPVINALSDEHHPCQALADVMTLRERFGPDRPLRVAYIGDGNNVAHSLVEVCALAGIDIAVATPPEYELEPHVLAAAERMSNRSGSLVLTGHDPMLAAANADAVYTDVWVSMGDHAEERDARRHAFAGYRIDDALMAIAAPDAVFLHCMPAHRGEEVSASVIDGPRSLVFEQAENRMWTELAVLDALLNRTLHGAEAMVVDVR